jgi:ABC-type uncharacterized transport system substrate-binding protein
MRILWISDFEFWIGRFGQKKALALVPAALLIALCSSAEAQELGKLYRVGYLAPGPIDESFRRALRDLGYTEGKNLAIEYRQGPDHYPELAIELVRAKVECILAVGVAATRAAKEATSEIPVVMGNASDDPVRQGLIASLARPGGNVTGVIDMLPDLASKRLELLRETFPKISRVGHLFQGSRGGPGTIHFKETEAAARLMGVRIQALHVASPEELDNAFQAAIQGGAEALMVVGTGFFISYRPRIINLELKNHLPAMHTHGAWVPTGGFMSYTTDEGARYRRAAVYVDKVLKGAKPADLPVERPTKFELLINLKTAKHIGVTIPPNVLARADRVIR